MIKPAYENRSDKDIRYPDFNEVYDLAVLSYQMDNKKDDTLIEVLRDLSDFNLFWSHGDEIPPIANYPTEHYWLTCTKCLY